MRDSTQVYLAYYLHLFSDFQTLRVSHTNNILVWRYLIIKYSIAGGTPICLRKDFNLIQGIYLFCYIFFVYLYILFVWKTFFFLIKKISIHGLERSHMFIRFRNPVSITSWQTNNETYFAPTGISLVEAIEFCNIYSHLKCSSNIHQDTTLGH